MEDCSVLITTVFCDGLDGEVNFCHWRYTSCKKIENIFNSKYHFNALISKTPILRISNLKLQDVHK